MEIEDAPAVAFAMAYLFMLSCAIGWVISEAYSRWREAHPKTRHWIYGSLHRPDGTQGSHVYRQCPETGEVQFILWRAGEQGHSQVYWHATDSFWWPYFVPHPSKSPDG